MENRQLSERGMNQLRTAIQNMRDACDDAERVLRRTPESPEVLCGLIVRTLTQGLANASLNIESALSWLGMDTETALYVSSKEG